MAIVNLQIEFIGPVTVRDAGQWLENELKLFDGKTAFEVRMSVKEAEIEPLCSQPDKLLTCFAGHIFDADREIRWTGEGDSYYLWSIEDSGSTGERVERTAQKYYCIGFAKNGGFCEPRLMRPVKYPLQPAQDGDRVYLDTYEYSPLKPDSTDIETLVAALNQPRILASRFYGLGCGSNPPAR